MGSKASVAPVIRHHFDTFRSSETNVPHVPDYAVFVVFPAIVGSIVWWRDVHFKEISGYLGGIAVFTGLLFALVIFVFQLRMQIASDQKLAQRQNLVPLINQLFYNVNYAVVAGVVTTAFGIAAVSTSDDKGAPSWISGVLAALGLHLLLTIFMCIKRVHSAYRILAK